jgi:hypothetical protein
LVFDVSAWRRMVRAPNYRFSTPCFPARELPVFDALKKDSECGIRPAKFDSKPRRRKPVVQAARMKASKTGSSGKRFHHEVTKGTKNLFHAETSKTGCQIWSAAA